MSLTYRRSSRWERLHSKNRSVRLNASSTEVVKIPMIGARNSGQAEVARLMRAVYGKQISNMGDEDTTMDVTPYTTLIRKLVFTRLNYLMCQLDDTNLTEPCNRFLETLKSFQTQDSSADIPKDVWLALKNLWLDKYVVEFYKQTVPVSIFDELKGYFEDLDRILSVNYIPSASDVLICRKKLNSIVETPLRENVWLLELGPISYATNLKKILQFFEKETAFVYCVDLSCYDLFENDGRTSKFLNALVEYRRIFSHEFTKTASIIVFLTNKEIFRKKLQTKNLSVCFREYSGTNSYDESTKYLTTQFRSQETKLRPVFVSFLSCDHSSAAIDLKIVRNTLNTCFLQRDISCLREA